MKDPRTALITGASSGIGRALSVWFARRGVRVFACARRLEALTDLQQEGAAAGGLIEPIRLDVTRTTETIDRIRQLDEECGGLDLVIANAGVGDRMSARKMTWDRVNPILQTNVIGAAATLVALVPKMVERDRGQLVGISSLGAFRGLPLMATYNGTKAFLSTFLEGLRIELAKSNVKVTCIQPGFVRSELTAKNKKMPFVLETDDAADRIGRAILRGDGEFSFPAPTALASKALQWMPNGLLDLMLSKRPQR